MQKQINYIHDLRYIFSEEHINIDYLLIYGLSYLNGGGISSTGSISSSSGTSSGGSS